MIFKNLITAAICVAMLPSCIGGNHVLDPVIDPVEMPDAFVLNQGASYNTIEGKLTGLNLFNKLSWPGLFKGINGRTLGDTPQCITIYEDRMYIGTYDSNTIEIIDLKSMKSLKQIRLESAGMGSQPRSCVAKDGKVYFSMYSGYVARLDVKSMELDAKVKVGPNPDIIAILGDKIYVPNSDGLNYLNGYGTTASIISLATFTVESTITTPLNPCQFITNGEKLYLRASGNYADIASMMFELKSDGEFEEVGLATICTLSDKWLYMVSYPWGSVPEFKKYNTKTGETIDFTLNGIDAITSIAVDKDDKWFIVTSSPYNGANPNYTLPGKISVFDSNLMPVWSCAGGVGPASFCFNLK